MTQCKAPLRDFGLTLKQCRWIDLFLPLYEEVSIANQVDDFMVPFMEMWKEQFPVWRTRSDNYSPLIWDDFSDTNGWDQGYIDSFLEWGVLPPVTDPELPRHPRGQGDKATHEWRKEADTYLDILLILEGRGPNVRACHRCKSETETVIYRCLTCNGLDLWCRSCVLAAHQCLPLHRIQIWTDGNYFERCSLKSLGLRIQLGHPPGEICPLPGPAWNDSFVILDLDEIHEVGLDFCGCGKTGKTQVQQLLERRLYPATVTSPKTVATFRLLEVLELLQYESKISAFEFHQSLSRLTCNTGLNPVKGMGMIRFVLPHKPIQGNVPSCALHVHIPASTFLKDGRMNQMKQTLDCNFRLKQKNTSSDQANPSFNNGCAYIVQDGPFRKFLEKHVDEVEPKSTCSRHDAVNLADSQPGQGYAASGVGTVECARHHTKQLNAVCDMQKGERYCIMDYILIMSLYLSLVRFFLISYDIACQWYIRLMERIEEIDKDCVLLKGDTEICFVVPKFHLPAHIPYCRNRFAFMMTPGAGLGDGEAPERGWSESNPLGPSTQEMGPGTQRDTLDAHFGDYNWRKIVALGESLFKKMKTATSDVAEHVIAHRELEATMSLEDVQAWTAAVVAWEKDPTQPNPYEMKVKTPTQVSVRRQLAKEEEEALQKGTDFSLHKDVSPSTLIASALDLEAEQCSIKTLMKQVWEHSQDRQLTCAQLQVNSLTRKLENWFQILQLYIPATVGLHKRYDTTTTIPPYGVCLWLPSDIGNLGPFDHRLGDIEYWLREAQAHEALGSLQRNLQIRATLYDVKDRWLCGQGSNTMALNAINTVQARINADAEDYRRGRLALFSLADILHLPKLDDVFLPLEQKDIRSMKEDDGKGETRRTLSWIWRQGDGSDVLSDQTGYVRDTLRVEWAKSQARALRHVKEIRIVKEEMQRTLQFFDWKAKEWDGAAVASGKVAYARRQAALCRFFHQSLETAWSKVNDMIATSNAEMIDSQLFYQRRAQEEAQRADWTAQERPPTPMPAATGSSIESR